MASPIYKCEPCGYSNELKTNYTRHCESAKHIVKCPCVPQTNTIDTYFKRIEVQVAEVVVVVQQNTVAIVEIKQELAEVRVELKSEFADIKALFMQQTARFEALFQQNELLRIEIAELKTVASQPKQRLRDDEGNKKSERQLSKESAATQAKKDVKAEKQHEKEQDYVEQVEEEEKDDVEMLKRTPVHLNMYFYDPERICGNTLGYVPSTEHRAYMAAAADANNEILFSGEFLDREPAKTKRGNQKLKLRNGEKRKREVEVVDVEQVERVRQQELTRDMTFEQGSYPWDNPRNEIIDWLKRPVRLCRTNRKVTPEHKAWFNGLLVEFGLPTV